MSAIYKLKKHIFCNIIDEVKKTFDNNKDILKVENIKSTELTKELYSYINLDMIIKKINLHCEDNKNYFYNIFFRLILSIKEKFYCNNEQIVFSLVEKVIQVVHFMNFNYYYNLNNYNINIVMPSINKDNLIKKCIIITWYSNINISTVLKD